MQVLPEDGQDQREWPELTKCTERQAAPAGLQVATTLTCPDQGTPARVLWTESPGEMLATASLLLDQSLLSCPRRQRRRGRRRRANSPLLPATVGEGRGGDDSRGVQKTFPQPEPNVMQSAAAEGAASSLPRLRGEVTAASLRTTTTRIDGTSTWACHCHASRMGGTRARPWTRSIR